MPGLVEACKNFFGKDNLYDVIGTTKEASEADLKKSYYRMSLRVHPDRVPETEKEEATAKFQALSQIYSILSDAETRKIYDETGEVGEESTSERDWSAHWRRMFPAITEEMIKNFYATYTGSEEEKEDLKSFYERFQGNMTKILEWMIQESESDAERLQNMIEEMIEAGSLQKTSSFVKTKLTKRKKVYRRKRAAEEAAEAEDMLKQIKEKHKMSEDVSLEALLRKRAEDRESLNGSFLEGLATKYGGAKEKR